jgi:hypothetical protein
MKTFSKFVFIALIICFHTSIVYANDIEVEVLGEYVMGDNDTKLEARRIALENAKLLAVEKIGTYLESHTIVKNGKLTKDEINSYASAIIKTEVVSEKVSVIENKTTVYNIRIKAKVDASVLKTKVKEIQLDSQRAKQVTTLQNENLRLLKELESLSNELKSDKVIAYKKLRKRRENVLEKLDKNENSIRIAFEKGTLFNLALKNSDDLSKAKLKIDKLFQFIYDNTSFKIGQPEVRNNGDFSDLIIPFNVKIARTAEILTKLALFSKHSMHGELGLMGSIYVYKFYFFGINSNKISEYFFKKKLKLIISAGNWETYFYVVEPVIYNTQVHIRTKVNERLTIHKIPTNKLSTIANIDARLVFEN